MITRSFCLAFCPADLGADAIKTGMLPNAEAVELVAQCVAAHRNRTASSSSISNGPSATASPSASQTANHHQPLPLVVDPVLVSTSGHSLAEGGVARALVDVLLPLATLATPNLPEAEALLGTGRPVQAVCCLVVGLQLRAKCLSARLAFTADNTQACV